MYIYALPCIFVYLQVRGHFLGGKNRNFVKKNGVKLVGHRHRCRLYPWWAAKSKLAHYRNFN